MENSPSAEEAPLLERAVLSLNGLSVGDAFGEMYAGRAQAARKAVSENVYPPGPWWHTDDTQMALAIVDELKRAGTIEPDALAKRFAARFGRDPERGYGKGARIILRAILDGVHWQQAAARVFSGSGSKGNGGAMRVGPLGAWFGNDFERLIAEAKKSAMVTHAHPEGIAGAIAVALAAAMAWRTHGQPLEDSQKALWQTVLAKTPEGETRQSLRRARELPPSKSVETAAKTLGNGSLVTAPDTVPFAIWCAARHLDNYQEAILATVEGDGDSDTNCAIVGGIVALHAGFDSIPPTWLASRERLDLL